MWPFLISTDWTLSVFRPLGLTLGSGDVCLRSCESAMLARLSGIIDWRSPAPGEGATLAADHDAWGLGGAELRGEVEEENDEEEEELTRGDRGEVMGELGPSAGPLAGRAGIGARVDCDPPPRLCPPAPPLGGPPLTDPPPRGPAPPPGPPRAGPVGGDGATETGAGPAGEDGSKETRAGVGLAAGGETIRVGLSGRSR